MFLFIALLLPLVALWATARVSLDPPPMGVKRVNRLVVAKVEAQLDDPPPVTTSTQEDSPDDLNDTELGEWEVVESEDDGTETNGPVDESELGDEVSVRRVALNKRPEVNARPIDVPPSREQQHLTETIVPRDVRADATRVQSLVEAYGTFWTHVRFTKGWQTPKFDRGSVEPLLVEAARISADIFAWLDERNARMKLRRLGGESVAFLFTVDRAPPIDALDERRDFVRGLVRATLRQGDVFVEGLSGRLVDRLFDELARRYSALA